MSEEALQIAERKREVKGKGERERYAQMKAESQSALLKIKNKDDTQNFQMKQILTEDKQHLWRAISFGNTAFQFIRWVIK